MSGPHFDLVMMVDWSAAATPRTGKDSIWIAAGTPDGEVVAANVPTRRRAAADLERALDRALEEDQRVLVGVDLAFGYPAGFAAHLALTGPPWERVWRYFASRIVDGDDNANNRFDVAAEVNRSLGSAVFWGCPKPFAGLSPTLKAPPAGLGPNPFSRLRHTDVLAGRGIRSVWQLYGGVTVGSQVLMGLPYLQRLRERYRDRLLVWPQETGFRPDPLRAAERARVVLAEIWPTALHPAHTEHGIRDEEQVRCGVERCLDRQEGDRGLGSWFAPSAALALAADARKAAVTEEGWILGVGADV